MCIYYLSFFQPSVHWLAHVILYILLSSDGWRDKIHHEKTMKLKFHHCYRSHPWLKVLMVNVASWSPGFMELNWITRFFCINAMKHLDFSTHAVKPNPLFVHLVLHTIRHDNICCQWIQAGNSTVISFIIPVCWFPLIATYHQQILIN